MKNYSSVEVQTNGGRTTVSRLERGRRWWLTKQETWSRYPDEADVFSDPESAEEVVDRISHQETATPSPAR